MAYLQPIKREITGSRGAISKTLIIVAALVLVVIITVFFALQLNSMKSKNQSANNSTNNSTANQPPQPVYDVTLGDVKYVLQDAQDLGSRLTSSVSYISDLTTTERFIQVTVSAENMGKTNTTSGQWDLGNIIDSDGRVFLQDQAAYSFLPKQPQSCGAILKPAFAPISCTRIYEVAKVSTGLKVEVKNSSANKKITTLDLPL